VFWSFSNTSVTAVLIVMLNECLYCYFSDFAYPTVKDRMPVILTKVIDTVFRKKAQVAVDLGTVSEVHFSCLHLFVNGS